MPYKLAGCGSRETQRFAFIVSYNPHQRPLNWVLLSPYCKEGEAQRSLNTSKVIQRINVKAGILIQSLTIHTLYFIGYSRSQ